MHFASFAVADAFGADAAAFAEVEVNYAAVGWGHWLQGDAASGLDDPVGDPVGHFAEGIFPATAILLDVQGDPDVLVELVADDALDDELQGLEGVAAASDEQPGVGAVDVDNRPAGELVVVGAEGDFHFGAHSVEDAFHDQNRGAGRGVRGFGRSRRRRAGFRCGGGGGRMRWVGGGQPRNADFGQLSADAEEALAAPI